ncbi:hypothetical protein SUGI_0851470 [Cryptomeria japonica]|nr:hypothetical protein SUGI_0851470 [Cryptomeria japonica]
MNVGDLTSIIDTKHMTATSFDGDACNPYMNHHNLSVDHTGGQSHSRLLLQQHQHQQQKSIYEEPPQALYEAGYLWPDLSAYGLPNVNNSIIAAGKQTVSTAHCFGFLLLVQVDRLWVFERIKFQCLKRAMR